MIDKSLLAAFPERSRLSARLVSAMGFLVMLLASPDISLAQEPSAATVDEKKIRECVQSIERTGALINANKDEKQGLIHPVRVRLDAADIDSKRVAISPDMAVSAEIVTGDRRVIEYVLSPILRHRYESGRER
jgi:hypothetical protein